MVANCEKGRQQKLALMRLFLTFIFSVCLSAQLQAQEVESLKLEANSCEKMLEGESPSSARIRAVDKAVFLGLKSLPNFDEDKKSLNDHDLNVMVYRLVDDYVEDLNSKVTKSDKEKVCVEISGFINPNNIETVRKEFDFRRNPQNVITDEELFEIASSVDADLTFKPKNLENVALLSVAPLEYYNGSKSTKYASFLKEKIKDSPYYYLTEDKDLADYIITPKVLKANIDALDESHKRLQMVVVLEVSGLSDENISVSQNRFLLFDLGENEQEIASRLIKKLLEASAQDVVRKIELKEQKKLENNALGRTL